MIYSLKTGRFAAFKLALLVALLGSVYALFSNRPQPVIAQAGARTLTNNCTRPNVEFITDSDLGATVVGSNFQRQVLARFGYRPYQFFYGLKNPDNTTVALSPAGLVSGSVANAATDTFDIKVNGASAVIPSKQYLIRTAAALTGTPLHFETSDTVITPLNAAISDQNITLPIAQTGDSYACTIQPNGGRPPYKLTVLEQPNGRFVPQGLAFDATQNLIFGKPVFATPTGQPAEIDIQLTDSLGDTVYGHFFINVLQGTIASKAVTVSGSMSLNFANVNGIDTLDLTMYIDKSLLNFNGIRTAADLTGVKIAMNFGGQRLPPAPRAGSTTSMTETFDSRGKINVPPARLVVGDVVNTKVVDAVYTISLDPLNGILRAHFANLKMIKNIGANYLSFEGQNDPLGPGPVIPISITLSTSSKTYLDQTENVKFIYRRNNALARGTANQNVAVSPEGLFLINKVTGFERQELVDPINNIKADRVYLNMYGFMRLPGGSPVIPLNNDMVTIFVNQLCLGMFPANSFAVSNNKLTFTNADPSIGLKSLVIDNNTGKVTILTHGLDPNNNLFGIDVLLGGDPQAISVTLTISGADITTATFDGQSSVTVFRNRSYILNK